jgi:glucose-6-phosphate isomerase
MDDLTATAAWGLLTAHRQAMARVHMRDLFAVDPDRFGRFSLRVGELLIDYSKNRVTEETLRLLCDLARQAELPGWIERMYRGEAVNGTERRPALHIALRNRGGEPIHVAGRDVMPAVASTLSEMGAFVAAVREGRKVGLTGHPLTSVVHIGIGGSDLGPRLAVAALASGKDQGPEIRFVANVDGQAIATCLDGLDPEKTLIVVASKSFSTAETMANAATAREWLTEKVGAAGVASHFVAVTAKASAARDFGIAPENIFDMWDWVGGRYSLWSAAGLPVALRFGMDAFTRLLEGAHAMDWHFRTAPREKNAPVILGLLGVWNANFLGAASTAIVPYDERLALLPEYLQQLEMESNGKSVRRDGNSVSYGTAPVIWGGVGSRGQHAFHQFLHQGTSAVPVDFIAMAQSGQPVGRHHAMLLANMLAQAAALMQGRTRAEVDADLVATGLSRDEIARLTPHMLMPGNRVSNVILGRQLDAYSLGAILALYEHKVFVQGIIWNIESFDQWGVEMGKRSAAQILPALEGQELGAGAADCSTVGLLGFLMDGGG